MSAELPEELEDLNIVEESAGPPPTLPSSLQQEERYFMLLTTAIRKCKEYKPKFGKGRKSGLTLQEFTQLYEADPFYHWLGIDSPLMYAAHKAAGGMTSIYRQVGIGSQWVFYQMLQDYLHLSPEQATWGYTSQGSGKKLRKFSLDGRIELQDIADVDAQARVRGWIQQAAKDLDLPDSTTTNLKGIVFEARQGYKSKDSGRQDKDLANAAKAYAHLYIPVLLVFSTQIDGDVAQRYRDHLMLLLTGVVSGPSTASTYAFCREVIGYDLADFFRRYSSQLRTEVAAVLEVLLSAEE